jgi:hypothetical protein
MYFHEKIVSCYGFYDACFNNPKPCFMNPKPCVLTRPFRIAFLFLLFTPLFNLITNAQNSAGFAGASFDSVRILNPVKGRGVLSDIDGDGKLDVVVADRYNNAQQFAVARNSGPAFYFASYVDIYAGDMTLGITTGDLDGDGKKDVVVQKPNNVGLFRNTSTPGTISFGTQVTYLTPYTNALTLASAGMADLDEDGKPELVLPHTGSQTICIYKNQSSPGSIVLDTNMIITTASGFTDMVMQDIDGDGKPEIIASLGGNGVDIYLNTSGSNNIAFASPVRLNYTAQSVKSGDLDGDGKADLVLANYPYAVVRNTSTAGSISFAAKQDLGVGGFYAALGDMDGDGRTDMVINANGGGMAVIKNTSTAGNISMAAHFPYFDANAQVPTTIVTGDVTGDGFPEIVCFATHFLTQGSQAYFWKNMASSNMTDIDNCGSSIITLTTDSDPSNHYQWQENRGYGWQDIYPDRTDFAGCWNDSLTISNITGSWNGYSYRCITDGIMGKIFNLRVNGTGATPAVSIAASNTTICAGTLVTFVATPANGGDHPTYQWQVNGLVTGNNNDSLTIHTLADGAQVKVVMTGTINPSCAIPGPVASHVINMTVIQPVTPSVTIVASDTAVCAGSPLTFTATPVNGGTAPAYQWKKNGVQAGTNSATYTDLFVNGDKVDVVLTSNALCATPVTANSDTVTVTVKPLVTPDIIISGDTTVDAGSSSHISASVSHQGNAPAYQWQDSTSAHGWQDIPGEVSEMIDYIPDSTGDKIRIRMTSNAHCATPAIVWSEALRFTVNTTGGRIVINPVTTTLQLGGLRQDDNWRVLEIWSVSNSNKVITVNIANLSNVSIPVNQLPNGMYVVVLKSSTHPPKYLRFLKM